MPSILAQDVPARSKEIAAVRITKRRDDDRI